MTRRGVALAVCVAAGLVASGCTTASAPAAAPSSGTGVASAAPPAVDPTVLPAVDRGEVPMRLADGLAPPTNRWFSGLVFGEAPQPVFPLPLAVGLTASGFAYGLPTARAEGAVLAGPYDPQVQMDLREPVTGIVTGYDAATVSVDLVAGDARVLGTLHLTRGSPVLRYTAAGDQQLGLGVPFAAGGDGLPDDVAAADVDGRAHVLVGAGDLDVAAALDGAGTTLALDEGASVSWLVAPDAGEEPGALADLVEAVRDPVRGTVVGYETGAEQVTTSVTYETAGGGPAVVVRWPHQQDAVGGPDSTGDAETTCGLGTYATVRGTVETCLATTSAWRSPAREPVAGPDVSGLDDAARDELAEQVRADAATVLAEVRPADTYFGGKALARDADLWVLARDLGLDGVAADLRASVVADLRTWTEPDGCADRPERCFTWEPTLRTVVGQATSFGSEEGNDHHFHYGYFLYAAGVLAADDGALAADLAPVLDLLAADVAAGADVPVSDGAPVPGLRVLDVVMGHSWASGQSPFADGNNQESASEAVAAWHGLALWAAAREAAGLDDAGMGEQARWLLALEAASARAYWTDFDTTDPAAAGLEASVTSLVWDGKRERATWFSAEPSAALGIVVLPVTEVSTYLGEDPARVRANLEEALGTDDLWADPATWDVLFGDQLLMYAALLGPQDAASALDVARDLPGERIDDGSTRSRLLAWLLARAA
ncbi:endoglucanase Acf2 [Isoptericola sp. CG 20/1183]|uniref:glucan endo-1,3-beta-D-glucosidase n=1 Tax=Isoptericola halotolerans TaxID=300560 RepID=A0ABX5EFZ8_9MICO|nr:MULTISPECIES: glycosyl hydrolase [Isoptericola]PRZ08331.1 endoglucanase Acf2 [Isoptericola halotolerans]PRZ09128.1 endoglucanase Acf2 [Isoptericola sp. CG 20/1183]